MSDEHAKRIGEALDIAFRYSQIDGDHHKAWVIDQMVRKLTKDHYNDWIKNYKGKYIKDDQYEGPEYDWNEGIAP
jgi:hypothetical protein